MQTPAAFISDADMEKFAPAASAPANTPPSFIPDEEAETFFNQAPPLATPAIVPNVPNPTPPTATDILAGPTVGAAKGAASSVLGIAKTALMGAPKMLANLISPALGSMTPTGDKFPGGVAASEKIDQGMLALEPKTTREKIGYYGERAAEFALPTGGATKAALTRTAADHAATAVSFINKAIGNSGRKSAQGVLSNDAKRLTGLETFYTLTKGKPIKAADGSSFDFDPTNIKDPHELLQAFVYAKKDVWQRVQAGLDKGSTVIPDYTAVESKLRAVLDPASGSTQQAKNHAITRLNEIADLKAQGVQAGQNYLQQINARLGATFSGASDAIPNKIDAEIAHDINGAIDDGLSRVTDANVRPLKDMYSALKSLEPDIVRMTQKVLRNPGKGIPQYINDFGNIELLEAAFAHNPALYVAKSAGMKVLAKVLGNQRDPLLNLSKAFKSVEKYVGAGKMPTEVPPLALPPGSRGTGPQIKSGPTMELPQRSPSTIDAAERANTSIKLPTLDNQNNGNYGKAQAGNNGHTDTLPPLGGSASALPAAAAIPAFQAATQDDTKPFPPINEKLNKADNPLRYDRGGRQDPLSYVRTEKKAATKLPGKSPRSYVIGDVDIAKWATDPDHEKKVTKIYGSIPATSTPNEINSYIREKFPKSAITGKDVYQAAKRHGIDPKLLLAMMQQDSSMGTAGLGKKTNNPANVGNDDDGNIRRFKSMREGVDAAAALLAKYKVDKKSQTASAAR